MDNVELDYFEYATDGAAQAAYVTDGGTSDKSKSYTTNSTSQRLGDSGGLEYWNAMKFVFASEVTITQATAYFNANVGTPSGQVTCSLQTDNVGSPSGTLAHANATLTFTPTASSNNTINWSDFTIPAGTYWLVFTCAAQTTDNGWAQAIGTPGDAFLKTSTNGGSTWSALNWDLYCSISATAQNLQCYSESTIKTQGSYSLKAVAAATDSLNDTLTHTFDPPKDLSGKTQIKYDVRASRTGENIKVTLHNSTGAGYDIEHTHNQSADEFETAEIDISAVADANKDAIDSIIVTVTNADAANTFYIDNMYGYTPYTKIVYISD
jgi:hypothetical protein